MAAGDVTVVASPSLTFAFSCFGRTYRAVLRAPSRPDASELDDIEARLRELLFSYELGTIELHQQVESLHQALTTAFPQHLPVPNPLTFARPSRERAQRVRRDLEAAVRSGRLFIGLEDRPAVRMARAPVAEAPRDPPPTLEEEPTFFEAFFVDEVGEGIAGVEVVLTVNAEKHELSSDGTGKVRVDGVFGSFGSVRVLSVDSVRDALKPRWDQVRQGTPFEPDDNSAVVFLRGDSIDSFALASETPFTISIQPHVLQARLLGMFFDTNKNFLLPNALVDIRRLPQLYAANPESKLLCVGHTDTTGEASINDPLSLERAQSLVAYLTDDVERWLAMYSTSVPAIKRWGTHEDILMIGAVAPEEVLEADNPVLAFQRFHNQLPPDGQPPAFQALSEDGVIGPLTRTQLIADYMHVDGTTLPPGVVPVVHGCGENFPLDAGAEGLDGAPEDEQRDQIDRRVEMFFFDGKLGVQPPPPGDNSAPGSLEYPEWRKRVRQREDLDRRFPSVLLRIRMLLNDEPVAGEEFVVRSGNRLIAGGTTEGDGLIVAQIPAGIGTIALRIPKLNLTRELELSANPDFPGAATLLGAQIRLHQLGFYFGLRNGSPSALFDDAVAVFKISQGLPASPELDGATETALVSAYGS